MELSRLCIALWQSYDLDLIGGLVSLASLSSLSQQSTGRLASAGHVNSFGPLTCLHAWIASQEHLCVPLTSHLTGGLEPIETPQIIATCDNGMSDVSHFSIVISTMANNHAL